MLGNSRLRRDPLVNWPPDQVSSPQLGATWPLDASAGLDVSSRSLPAALAAASSSKSLPVERRPQSSPAPLSRDKAGLAQDLAAASGAQRSSSASRRARGRASFGGIGRSIPIPCANTGKRHVGIPGSDELIDIDLYFHESSDRVSIRLHPDTRIGPDIPPKPVRGAAASVPVGGAVTGDYESTPTEVAMTLKGLVAQMTGLEPSQQRLLCRGFDVSMDQMTLRAYGITHGQTVMVHQKVLQVRGRKQPMLACTAKKTEKQERRKQQLQQYTAALKDRSHTRIMPKWFVQLNTKMYTKPGFPAPGEIQNPLLHFGNYDSWTADQAEPTLMHVRRGQTYNHPLEFERSEA